MSKNINSGATLLSQLSAVAFDTETTGLDPAKARIVEFGAIGIRRGVRVESETFQWLVNPGIKVEKASFAVHGISDGELADALSFPAVFGKFERFVAGRLLIGHSIGFDIALLDAEADRNGLDWKRPRSLCVRMLGIIAAGELPDYSLETLAARLGVEITDRHRALGDAKAAADVFSSLVPLLEKRGIRTLAEAERAMLGLQSELDRHARAGWVEPVQRGAGSTPKGDPFAYRHRVRDVMSADPVCAPASMKAENAISLMAERKISSIFVNETGLAGGPLSSYGIITERDMMRAIAAMGAGALKVPIGDLANKPLASVREEAFIYRAIGRMDRLKIRHLAVRTDDDRLSGVISARDMLRLRAAAQFVLDDSIESAESASDLANAWSSVPGMVESLSGEDVPPRTITAVISEEIRAITRSAARLAESEMLKNGQGSPPCPFTVLVLGSGGRGESMLKPDQDNALIYTPLAGAPDPDAWFAAFSEHMNAILDRAGIHFCEGGIMAKNPAWRGTPETWAARVSRWISRADPEDILNADIYFDFMPVHGDIALGLSQFEAAYAAASRDIGFAKALASGLERMAAPITLFGGIKLQEGRVDLKLHGLFPVVAFARAAAIRHGIAERSTTERLRRLGEEGHVPTGEINKLDRAHETIVATLLEQQRRDIMAGLKPSSRVDPSWIDANGKTRLKTALSDLSVTATLARDTMF